MLRGCRHDGRIVCGGVGIDAAKTKFVRLANAIHPVHCRVRCCVWQGLVQCHAGAVLGGAVRNRNHDPLERCSGAGEDDPVYR